MMICQICKQDHSDKNGIWCKNIYWCDRSDSEILRDDFIEKIKKLEAENARYREALENASARSHEVSCDWFNPNDDKCNCILSLIHKALKGE